MPRSLRCAWFGIYVAVLTHAAACLAADVHGRRFEIDGLPAVEVWGTPREAGFAQGYLLAEETVRIFDSFVLAPQISRSPATYEQMLKPGVQRMFRWSDPARDELEGIVAGVRAKLGENARSRKLDRELTIEDLQVANTLSDWRGIMCSTVSVWGDLTTDGRTLTARNLDYPIAGEVDKAQLILIHRGENPDTDAGGWVSVTWPALVGVYTAMNAEGVCVSIHDARGLPANAAEPGEYFTRPLVLRDALEHARAPSFADDFRRLLADRPVVCGSNIHISGPLLSTPAIAPSDATRVAPAVVFEWDGNRKEHGLAMRVGGSNRAIVGDDGPGRPRGPAADPASASDADAALPCLFCTNHMRSRSEPTKCGRYAKLNDAVREKADAHEKYDAAGALGLIRSVANETTQHSVVFMPDARRMLVLIPALRDKPVELDVAKLLAARKSTSTGAGH